MGCTNSINNASPHIPQTISAHKFDEIHRDISELCLLKCDAEDRVQPNCTSRFIDDTTSIPTDIFEDFLRAGQCARLRGQHIQRTDATGRRVLRHWSPHRAYKTETFFRAKALSNQKKKKQCSILLSSEISPSIDSLGDHLGLQDVAPGCDFAGDVLTWDAAVTSTKFSEHLPHVKHVFVDQNSDPLNELSLPGALRAIVVRKA